MITEIMIHNVEELEIKTSRLPEPCKNCTSIHIDVGVSDVGGDLLWQTITLFVFDGPHAKFEDSELARKIKRFNEVEREDASWIK